MNWFPSSSSTWLPQPRLMNSGCPPTDLKARTGLLTPPGKTRCDCSKSDVDRLIVSVAAWSSLLARPIEAYRRHIELRAPTGAQARGAAVLLGIEAEQLAGESGVALGIQVAPTMLEPNQRLVQELVHDRPGEGGDYLAVALGQLRQAPQGALQLRLADRFRVRQQRPDGRSAVQRVAP